jgi:hypothetical protein
VVTRALIDVQDCGCMGVTVEGRGDACNKLSVRSIHMRALFWRRCEDEHPWTGATIDEAS